MSDDYGCHKDYLRWVENDAVQRSKSVENELRTAFKKYIEYRKVEVILFSEIDSNSLGQVLYEHPTVLKPILATCNLAGRAVERDLGIKNLNTYEPHIDQNTALILAGYIKPFLPESLELNAISHLDKIYFVDKEIRKTKGNWEKEILQSLNKLSKRKYKKRKFECEGELFEIDAANPADGDIAVAVDVKRIEARRDLHKRCDEIVNKAEKLKRAFPSSFFGVVIYFPFPSEHINISNRLSSDKIDSVQFAGGSKESIDSAVQFLLSKLCGRQK